MSSRYRRVKTSMHSDEKYQRLSRPQPNGQSLWQHLLHGPETTMIPGVVLAGRAGMAEALRWPQEAFDKAFQEVLDLDMARVDWDARLIWLPRGPYHNVPQSTNVIKAWGKAWPEVPSCALKDEILQELKVFADTLKPAFRKAFDDVFSEALGNTETGTGAEILLPVWLDLAAWQDWNAYRAERRIPMTPTAIRRQLALLERHKDQQRKIIDEAINSGWRGIFPPKDPHGNHRKSGGQSAPERVAAANAKYQ